MNGERTPLAEDPRRLVNGARVASHRVVALRPPETPIPKLTAEGEAHRIALANQHKPWARRYLRRYGRFY